MVTKYLLNIISACEFMDSKHLLKVNVLLVLKRFVKKVISSL